MGRVNEIETTAIITVRCCSNCEHVFGYEESPECRERPSEDIWHDNLCSQYIRQEESEQTIKSKIDK